MRSDRFRTWVSETDVWDCDANWDADKEMKSEGYEFFGAGTISNEKGRVGIARVYKRHPPTVSEAARELLKAFAHAWHSCDSRMVYSFPILGRLTRTERLALEALAKAMENSGW